ncbi:VirB4 family type IV secretion system protein [Nitrosopumilus ureiphilus]|uniref:Uncharacterized protein n=1 Tax=Nitrosopumilus ureiphilus TaxID=1470067 RepID=A0A7D5M5R9_9ARCH|nr:DUF87 domain-containing protein [Nitrosopumilus ureiphilus]QLH07095.1 hypothetical protein C5F50_08440 [Nitrosopumilus ureiphilus]
MNLKRFKYFYTVTATNFITLPEEKQVRKLGEFFDILRVIEKEIHIIFSRKMLPVPIEGVITDMPIIQIQMSSQEPLDDIFDRLKFEYSIDEEHASYEISKEHLRHFRIPNKTGPDAYGKCMTLYSVPSSLPSAWIHSIFSACSRIDIYITPITQDKAIKIMDSKSKMLYELATRSKKILEECQKVDAIKTALQKSQTSLFHVAVNCTIIGPTMREMKKAVKDFRKNASIAGGRFTSTPSKQAAMINGWGARLSMDIGSTAILYAFVSADMLEVPNGVVLGINVNTGAPVIYDPAKRTNYNFAIIGKSGSGKSFTVKILLKRLIEKYPDCFCFVIDPMGEYYKIASYLGLDAIQITESKEFGFDPFNMLEPLDAVDILGQATKAPPEVIKLWRSLLAQNIKNISELYESSDENAQRYLVDLVKGPLSTIMKGEPQMSDKIIISMKGTGTEEHTVLILLMALSKAWKRITELLPTKKKILLIDEGWMLFKMQGAEKYIDMIVRMGRKLNVTFIFVSQKVEDLANEKGGYGRIIDNIETKVLMLMEEDAAAKAGKILQLSLHEVDQITSFDVGNGIFITKKHRLHVKFEATPEEKEIHFNTAPETENPSEQ